MFETLKKFIEERGAINASFHRIESALKANRITQEEYTTLLDMLMSM